MKNKLHTTSCHPEATRDLIPKFSNFQILLFSIFYVLFSIPATAQTYNWDWGVSGGGMAGDLGNEHIYDIKVGTDNNYYFIAPLWGGSGHQLDGQSLPTYNVAGSAAKDILLFSTTCDGTIRWSHVLGGGSQDDAYNLVLDSQNNVYIGIRMGLGSTTNQKPVYFSPTDSLPLTPAIEPSDYYKTTFLVKFSSTGQYLGKKALQGDVGSYYPSSPSNFSSSISDLAISNDTLHFIAGLHYGLHLDDNVTVPSKYHYDPLNPTSGQGMQYHLAKYDTSLNYISSMVLPVADNSVFQHETTRFAYDEKLNRYYIAGHREGGALVPLTYDSSSVINRSFLFAIDGTDGGLLWHRELYSNPTGGIAIQTNRFKSIKIDTNSDVYVGGDLFKNQNEQNLKIYDPNDTSVTPYLFTPGADFTIPMIFKINSNGVVQWVQATAAYNTTAGTPGPRYGKGIAIKNNEVAFGTQAANEFWDNFQIQRPFSHSPDPLLVRLNKQTGQVIAIHDIMGGASLDQITALEVDRDGNYVVGGFFYGSSLFNNTPNITPLVGAGQSDFFVAKLGAYACGTNSTEKFNNIKVNVYPNPTNDIINIETDETLLNYVVYDMNGREIQNGMFGSSNQLNLQNATNGVYFVKVTTVYNNVATVRVIKK